jgi:hypothetical protein
VAPPGRSPPPGVARDGWASIASGLRKKRTFDCLLQRVDFAVRYRQPIWPVLTVGISYPDCGSPLEVVVDAVGGI